MSSKLLAVQIANVANAQTARRDVQRPRHRKPASTATAGRTAAVPESPRTIPLPRVRPIRSIAAAAVRAIARAFAAPATRN
jgi:hypothetical protein